MATTDLLTKKLHQLTSQEVRSLRQIADEVFEPLTRPFRQKRTEDVFSVRKTIQSAARNGGDMLPSYDHKVREHRKSRLVIAMSLSGIDRCAAVGLIPLFHELQKFLDFKLLIYTDDIIPAKFTRDGFLENDIDIAWNNVAAPVVFNRIADMQFDRKEDTLLVIDNFGGGDSEWFQYWNQDYRKKAQEEQEEYYARHDNLHGFWNKLREELGGDYDKIHTSSYARGLKSWQSIVDRNVKQRWVDAPAMMDYLVRWLFHPEFGRTSHSQYRLSAYGIHAEPAIRRIKGKFKTVHWLRTVDHKTSQYIQNDVLRLNVIDYLHQANTIEGFATVLSNIVHGRCTNKLTKDNIVFATLIDEPIDDDGTEGEHEVDHLEVYEGKEACFKNAVKPEKWLPKELEWTTSIWSRSDKDIKEMSSPWATVDVSDWFPGRDGSGLNAESFVPMMALTPRFQITSSMSRFSLLEEATKIIESIKKNKIVHGGHGSLTVTRREGSLSENPNYERHQTRRLEKHVKDYLSLWSEDYATYTNHLPLTNVLWCNGGVYRAQVLGYAVPFGDGNLEDAKRTVFHEHGHHFEHIVPEIGAFTNYLIQRKVGISKAGYLDKSKLTPVYGGKAMPVTDGSTPWITSYAGKWYDRKHEKLPVMTEIISVHSEYFQSPEALLTLMNHDPFMVKFLSFVFMGGPVAAIKASQHVKTTAALDSLRQNNMKETASTTKMSRGSGGGRRGSQGRSRSSTKKDRSKSFGV